jgi:hypothetical protein
MYEILFQFCTYVVHFCTPDDVRNILSIIYKILSQFVKPPSDTLLRYIAFRL